MPGERRDRFVIGLTGSSAPQLGVSLLRALRELDVVESHLVVSAGAEESIRLEMGMDPDDVLALADVAYDPRDLAASISSGSFTTLGMVVVPCSMRSLAAVATGISDNLLTRAADVTLKERRPLVLVVRETPLSLIHIENMQRATLAGAIVLPPVPAFYHRPRSIQDLLDHTCGKILDQFRIEHRLYRRWEGPGEDQLAGADPAG